MQIHTHYGHFKRFNMKHALNILFVISLLTGCKVADELNLQKMNNSGNNVNLGGYFSREIEKEFYEVFFLYEDGVFLSGGAMRIDGDEKSLDDSIMNFIDLGYYKNIQYGWGVWARENQQIVIEKWLSGNGGPYPVGKYVGEIINDTTINIAFTYQLPPKGSEEKKLFHFRAFEFKPDSTNAYIK